MELVNLRAISQWDATGYPFCSFISHVSIGLREPPLLRLQGRQGHLHPAREDRRVASSFCEYIEIQKRKKSREARAEVARLHVEREAAARGEAEAVGAQVRHKP